jgi:2-iminobutanoate/2-iminopropanoate deaminase
LLPHQLKDHSTRPIAGLLCGLILATAVTGCADTPKRGGMPWWPQGPGDVSQDALPAPSFSVAKGAHTPRSPATPAIHKHPQAVRYGDLLFVSGQLADEPASLEIVESDIQAQVRSAMDNLKRILEIHSLTMSNVLSVTLYLQDIDELAKVDEVYASYFRRGLPSRSVVRVSGMPNGSLVEISAIAGK